MLTNPQQLKNLNHLREYVVAVLCEHDELEIGAFRVTERILVRAKRPCGIFFCLHGPRSVKITAIWETERNTILFYGSNGERFQRTQLHRGPRLESVLCQSA